MPCWIPPPRSQPRPSRARALSRAERRVRAGPRAAAPLIGSVGLIDHDFVSRLEVLAGDLDQGAVVEPSRHLHRPQRAVTVQHPDPALMDARARGPALAPAPPAAGPPGARAGGSVLGSAVALPRALGARAAPRAGS